MLGIVQHCIVISFKTILTNFTVGAQLSGRALGFQLLGHRFNSRLSLCWIAVSSFVALPWSLPVLISPSGAEIQDVKLTNFINYHYLLYKLICCIITIYYFYMFIVIHQSLCLCTQRPPDIKPPVLFISTYIRCSLIHPTWLSCCNFRN